MLIRTSVGQLWYAWPSDDGRYWRVLIPSGVDAISGPGWLLRLADGRLAPAWNRWSPSGVADWPKFNTPDPTFECPASLYGEDLSVVLSEDDGESWTPARTIGRQPGGQLAYPYLHEHAPGTLWIDGPGTDKPEAGKGDRGLAKLAISGCPRLGRCLGGEGIRGFPLLAGAADKLMQTSLARLAMPCRIAVLPRPTRRPDRGPPGPESGSARA